MLIFLLAVLSPLLALGTIFNGVRLSDDGSVELPLVVGREIDADVDTKLLKHVVCRGPHLKACPNFLSDCSRAVLDNKFRAEDITALHAIAAKGMGARDKIGGPTILDINTGFLRDSAGLVNLFSAEAARANHGEGLLIAEDFEVYGRIIKQLKDLVSETFQYQGLHFTAPTFITRLDGDTPWEPREIHDEYWHKHADHNNTEHYHFSGLLYMSEYQKDFEGGRLLFYGQDDSSDEPTEVVEPAPGRVVMFSSGAENPHRVERVTAGERFVLAFWFTCDPAREFEIFLDGEAHLEFSGKIKGQLERQSQQRQQQEMARREAEAANSKDQMMDL
mmetsp:Transcript_23611/g.40121  ORF Transcript_23611/g.40121 Transcript_23611/m.40121 type:complete len:333 (-) Transcript_23611:170-1168(-)